MSSDQDGQNGKNPKEILIYAQELMADYMSWTIIIIAFIVNILEFLGLLDGTWIHDKLYAINAILIIGFILTYFKTANQVNSIDNAISRVEKALGTKLKDKNLDIFISAPITSFLPDTDRERDFKSTEYTYFNRLCTHVVRSLKHEYPNIRIHYEGSKLTTYEKVQAFKADNRKRAQSFENIDHSKHLIAIFPDMKLTSGSLVEIGYALGKGVACIMFHPANSKALNIPSITIANSGRPSEGKCLSQSYDSAETPEEAGDDILRYIRDFLIYS
jgi:hypothetical protein